MKKIAIDSYYQDESICKTVGVIFNSWTDTEPEKEIECLTSNFEPYIPGEFYKRELPGILELLKQVNLEEFDTIIVDSFLELIDKESNTRKPGLGLHLADNLAKTGQLHKGLNIIGVAKSKFGKTGKISTAIYRGESKKPLWIQSLNKSNLDAGELIKNMAGPYRLPALLKILDKRTKNK
jgi:deoxyinosine 3'endonuclease (endonuclease V)